MPDEYSFGYLFRSFRVRAGFKTLSQLADSFANRGYVFEDSIFSHWQRGSRIPTNRNIVLTLIKIFVSHNAISSIAEANLFLESSGHGYLTNSESVEVFPKVPELVESGGNFSYGVNRLHDSKTATKQVKNSIANMFLINNIARFNFKNPYTFTTGLKSPIFIDNRLLLSYPKERSWVVDELIAFITKSIHLDQIDYISSTFSFAAPFGVLVSNALNLPLILVHDKKTEYGRYTKIEGHMPRGKRVLLIEDIISTGVGAIDNYETVKMAGGIVKNCIAIVDYRIDIVKKSLRDIGLKTTSLISGSEILKEAKKQNLLSNNEVKDVEEWFNAPFRWGLEKGFYNKNEKDEKYY